MKKFAVGIVLALIVSGVSNAEFITLTLSAENRTNSIVLLEGDSLELVFKHNWKAPCIAGIETPKETFWFDYSNFNTGMKLGGPATVTLLMPGSTIGEPTFLTFQKTASSNPNTLQVIPRGTGAVVYLQTTDDLVSGQWTTLFSQVYTGSAPSNRFFKFVISTQ